MENEKQELHLAKSQDDVLTASNTVIPQLPTIDIVSFESSWLHAVDLFFTEDYKGALKQTRRLLRALKPPSATESQNSPQHFLVETVTPLLWFNIGQINLLLHRHSDAAEAFNSSIKHDEHSILAHCGLGIALFKLGALNGSAKTFKKSEVAFDKALAIMGKMGVKEVNCNMELDLRASKIGHLKDDEDEKNATSPRHLGRSERVKNFLLKHAPLDFSKKLSAVYKDKAESVKKSTKPAKAKRAGPMSTHNLIASGTTVAARSSSKKVYDNPFANMTLPSPNPFMGEVSPVDTLLSEEKLITIPSNLIHEPKDHSDHLNSAARDAYSLWSQEEQELLTGEYHDAITSICGAQTDHVREMIEILGKGEKLFDAPAYAKSAMKTALRIDTNAARHQYQRRTPSLQDSVGTPISTVSPMIEVFTSNREGFPTASPGTPSSTIAIPLSPKNARNSIIFEREVQRASPDFETLVPQKGTGDGVATPGMGPGPMLLPTVFEGLENYHGPSMFGPRRLSGL
ncbi:hypothetical protein MMC13_007003 [Lambiella insularis]|nr:hypothetical protein [Lambiella insularis]